MMSRPLSLAGMAVTPMDRVVTACIAAGAAALVAACAPLAAMLFLRNHAIGLLDVYAGFSHWGLAVATLAGTVGFMCGADRTIVLSHHLLLTARPRNPLLTAGLWTAVALCAGVSTWLC